MTADQLRQRIRRPMIMAGTAALSACLIGVGWAYVTDTPQARANIVYRAAEHHHALGTFGIMLIVTGCTLWTIFFEKLWPIGFCGAWLGVYAEWTLAGSFYAAFQHHGAGKAGVFNQSLPAILLFLAAFATLQEHLGIPNPLRWWRKQRLARTAG